MADIDERAGVRIRVRGTVQGVGFRPFVVRLARELAVDGYVLNTRGDVVIDAAGTTGALTLLVERLAAQAPPQARISAVDVAELAQPATPAGAGFGVRPSASDARQVGVAEVVPDLAVCDACAREVLDPADRRYRYPFTNCTGCGPRATVIDTLPYDRHRTVMRAFPLCHRCSAEYGDPDDRRFHAEPVACPDCGPRLDWTPAAGRSPGTGTGPLLAQAALTAAVAALTAEQIVAVKGLGGYQLVCDATDAGAIRALRERKRRPARPLAVMVADLPAARRLAHLTPVHERLLAGPERPVVLAPARFDDGAALAPGVHPDLDEIGLFLPTTPLHLLLLHDLARPLVVTSGNGADRPVAITAADAGQQLAGIADGFLGHDRPIRSRYDDSVLRVRAGRASVVRRARGYAPGPVALVSPAPEPLLALGAQLKHTCCLAVDDRAVLGPHHGDLADADTLAGVERDLDHLCRMHGVAPDVIAHDLHPGYLSTQLAMRRPARRRIAVQHHHAHVAACAAENGLVGPFIGVAYDGLGLGDDGTWWGGEVLVADLRSYRRVARFGTAPMPGGAAAVRDPARMALGYLLGSESGRVDPGLAAPFLDRQDGDRVRVLTRMVDRGVNSPQTSSAGRLFDAVASLLGLGDDVSYEAQAAIALEVAARRAPDVDGAARYGDTLPWVLNDVDALIVYDPVPTLEAVLAGVARGVDTATLAARFHRTVAAVTVRLCDRVAHRTGLDDVCLGGGVFQNRLLTDLVVKGLRRRGLTAHVSRLVPTNDGGISYGQAAVAAARLGQE